MRTRLHRFLLLLLMLVLPLQAFASAAMYGCASSHPADMEHMAMADHATAGCHGSEHPERAPASHDCKHCSACVLGPVLPIPVDGKLSLLSAPAGFAARPAVVFSGFIPDGPERPPRPFLA